VTRFSSYAPGVDDTLLVEHPFGGELVSTEGMKEQERARGGQRTPVKTCWQTTIANDDVALPLAA